MGLLMGLFSTFCGSRTQESVETPNDFGYMRVQYQDRSGNWIDHESFPSGGTNPYRFMLRAGAVLPGKRIRVVDSRGRLVDNL